MSKLHELKTAPDHLDSVIDGSKPFELRCNDRAFQKGDTLLLREYRSASYGPRAVLATVTHVLSGKPWLADNYVALGIRVDKIDLLHYGSGLGVKEDE